MTYPKLNYDWFVTLPGFKSTLRGVRPDIGLFCRILLGLEGPPPCDEVALARIRVTALEHLIASGAPARRILQTASRALEVGLDDGSLHESHECDTVSRCAAAVLALPSLKLSCGKCPRWTPPTPREAWEYLFRRAWNFMNVGSDTHGREIAAEAARSLGILIEDRSIKLVSELNVQFKDKDEILLGLLDYRGICSDEALILFARRIEEFGTGFPEAGLVTGLEASVRLALQETVE